MRACFKNSSPLPERIGRIPPPADFNEFLLKRLERRMRRNPPTSIFQKLDVNFFKRIREKGASFRLKNTFETIGFERLKILPRKVFSDAFDSPRNLKNDISYMSCVIEGLNDRLHQPNHRRFRNRRYLNQLLSFKIGMMGQDPISKL